MPCLGSATSAELEYWILTNVSQKGLSTKLYSFLLKYVRTNPSIPKPTAGPSESFFILCWLVSSILLTKSLLETSVTEACFILLETVKPKSKHRGIFSMTKRLRKPSSTTLSVRPLSPRDRRQLHLSTYARGCLSKTLLRD